MSSKKLETLYETLGLPETCSSQEIRNAFVNLSKTYHPDKNLDNKDLHAKFVKINEAYTILSKPESRGDYDNSLRNYRTFGFQATRNFNRGSSVRSTAPNYYEYKGDGSFWHNRDRSKDGPIDDMNYYGIKGIRKKSNSWIAMGCVMLMGVGIVAHYTFVRTRVKYNLGLLDERDQRLGVRLYNARKTAQENGNQKQLELLEKKMSPQYKPHPEELSVDD